MNSRLVCGSVVAGIVFGLFAGPVALADDLISIDRAKISSAKKEYNIRVIAKLDDIAVALFPGGDFEKLKKADNTAGLIQQSTDIERLWVRSVKGFDDISPGLILATDNYHLLSIDLEEALSLMKDGAILSKCLDIDLPADPLFTVPAKLQTSSLIATDIDSLMALVSVDSVIANLQRLQDFQTRYTCTDSFWAAGNWISSRFAAWGYDSLAFQEFDSPFNCVSRNVIATKTGDIYPDRFIIVGGHYDAVVYDGGNPNVYAPGVDDNGTGTALTMEIARVLADVPFKKSVRFITFGAEEQGLIGSWHYVADALNRQENIEYMINADMIGNVADSYLDFFIRCNERGEHYGQVIEQLANQYSNLVPILEVGEWAGSDHFPFDQAGFRAIYSAEGDFSPNWHMQTDILSNVDPEYIADIIRLNLGALLIAIESPSPILGLQAFNSGDGETVYLQWEPSPDIEVIGYEIYFGTSEQGVVVYDTAYSPADTVTGLMENSTYYFGVAGFTADGASSPIEEFVSIVPHSVPSRADTLIVVPELYQNRVQWSALPDFDFAYYQVYRRVGQSGGFQPYRQVPDSMEFVDTALQSNVRYYYYVTLVDTTSLESEPSNNDYAKVLSFDSGILLVDETRDFNGGQGLPTDAEQDSFFQFISAGYPVAFHDYIDDGPIRINDLGPYSTVVWVDDDAANQQLYYVDNELADYIDGGGNLLFVGWRSFYGYSNTRPLSFYPGDFPFDYLFIESVNSSNIPDFTGASGSSGWPDVYVMSDRVVPVWEGKLIGVDIMNIRDGADEIYYYLSASGDTLFEGKPAGIIVDYPNSAAIYLTFPLYPLGDQSAAAVFSAAMDYLGEETTIISGTENGVELPDAFLWQNYPNPFNAETTIKLMLNTPGNLHLAVYNVLGQEVEVLAHRQMAAGVHIFTWGGIEYPSGIYFYRLTFNDISMSRRMILLR